MKQTHIFLSLFVTVMLLTFSSCKKDKPNTTDDTTNDIEIKTVTINASDYAKWVYFSFEKGEIVAESPVLESIEDMSWDIAFHRYNVRINSGKSGPGNGGALVAKDKIGKKGFDALTLAPESGYAVDDSIMVMPEFVMPPPYVKVPGNAVITGGQEGTAILFSMETVSYTPTDQIFVIKTADEKYAKIWITDFYNEDAESGHITMKYYYQSDGSRSI